MKWLLICITLCGCGLEIGHKDYKSNPDNFEPAGSGRTIQIIKRF